MKQDRANSVLSLSSKTPHRGEQPKNRDGLELGGSRADLEAEQSRRQQRALWRFSVELRHLREDAEAELQRAWKELTARRARQEATLGAPDARTERPSRLFRKALVQPWVVGGDGEDEDSWRGSTCRDGGGGGGGGGGGKTDQELEQLLLRLYEEIHADEAVSGLHDREELELEKALFLCRLLEAHGTLTLPEGKPSRRSGGSVRGPSQGHTVDHHHHSYHHRSPPKPPQNSPLRSPSPSTTQSTPPPPAPQFKKPRPEPSGWDGFTAGHVSPVVLGDTCCSGRSPDPRPTQSSPREGGGHSEEDQSPHTKWSQRTMDQVRV